MSNEPPDTTGESDFEPLRATRRAALRGAGLAGLLAMQRGTRLNSELLVLGIFGGVAVFGFLGSSSAQSYWGCRKPSSICQWRYVVRLEISGKRPACANHCPTAILYLR